MPDNRPPEVITRPRYVMLSRKAMDTWYLEALEIAKSTGPGDAHDIAVRMATTIDFLRQTLDDEDLVPPLAVIGSWSRSATA